MPTRRQGFTLVELLVVVSLIVMLISILLPSLSRARELSRRAVCASNLRQQAMSFTVYATDSRGFIPFGYVGECKQYDYNIYELGLRFATPLGLIYRAGLLPLRSNWTCPSRVAGGDNLNPVWPPGSVYSNSRSHFGIRTTPDTGSNSTAACWGRDGSSYFSKLSRTHLNKALLADYCSSPATVDNCHGDGANVAYFDAHVGYVHRAGFDPYLKRIGNNPQSPAYNYDFRAIWDVFDGS